MGIHSDDDEIINHPFATFPIYKKINAPHAWFGMEQSENLEDAGAGIPDSIQGGPITASPQEPDLKDYERSTRTVDANDIESIIANITATLKDND